MCSLDLFPSPQCLNNRTLRESKEYLEEGISDCVVIDEANIYPTIEIKTENIIKPSIISQTVDNIFIQKDTTLWKQFTDCVKHRGLVSGLQLIRDSDQQYRHPNNRFLQMSRKLSQFLLYLWNLLLTFYVYLYPFVLKTNEELCTEFNESMDWKNGLIRAFQWHPKCVKCAICLINDSIYIYSSDNSFVPLLKHSLQSKVVSISWSPVCEDLLAVCCESVVLLWTIDPNSRQYRLSTECLKVITSPFSPLTDMTFDPSGRYLSVCSPQSSKLVVIDIDSNLKEVKSRHLGTCFTKLYWSPDGSRLLSCTTSKYIRIFETNSWTSDKWTQFDNICQTMCWSRPNGRLLLISPKDSVSVYAIAFYDSPQPKDVGGSHVLHKVLDVSEHQFSNGIKVGGRIHQMVWDKNSERLAISFKENSRFIGLYKTVIRPNLEITPIGFIHGFRDEIPLLMSFHDCFTKGSLLTICWNSGVVSYIPLEFDLKSNKSIYTNGTPRSLTSFCISSPNRNNSMNLSSTPVKPVSNCGGIETKPNSCHSIKFNPNDSVLSPKRPLLFSTALTKRYLDFESIE